MIERFFSAFIIITLHLLALLHLHRLAAFKPVVLKSGAEIKIGSVDKRFVFSCESSGACVHVSTGRVTWQCVCVYVHVCVHVCVCVCEHQQGHMAACLCV